MCVCVFCFFFFFVLHKISHFFFHYQNFANTSLLIQLFVIKMKFNLLISIFYTFFGKKVYFRSQILECPSIGQYWNIFGVPVLPENVILLSLEHASVIHKLTILEHKNGLVLSNTRVPVSGT